MSLLELPEAVVSALSSIGGFFHWVYWIFFTIGWALTFVFYIVAFFGIQVFFIYLYYRMFLLLLGFKPKIEQFLEKVDKIFD
jgi:hypothetical protein